MPTVGYSFWGFLGDYKMDNKKHLVSTPDGNAFYSWAIIKGLQEAGYDVVQLMPDRDKPAYESLGSEDFKAFAGSDREKAYLRTSKVDYLDDVSKMDMNDVIGKWGAWDEKLPEAPEFILHEWRMDIKGRNDYDSKERLGASWQPDVFIQNCVISYCLENEVPLFIFDLDYKLSYSKAKRLKELGLNFCVVELGDRWEAIEDIKSVKVAIPFSKEAIEELPVISDENWIEDSLVYVGNRYERDWCIDQYWPDGLADTKVYGNWLEGGRDSAEMWPNINFGPRLQTADMFRTYSKAETTILFAKASYCKYKFMTARVLEAVTYSCVPLFIADYGEDLIKNYAGKYASLLTVRDKASVVDKCFIFNNLELREKVIKYLRLRLGRMHDYHKFIYELEYQKRSM